MVAFTTDTAYSDVLNGMSDDNTIDSSALQNTMIQGYTGNGLVIDFVNNFTDRIILKDSFFNSFKPDITDPVIPDNFASICNIIPGSNNGNTINDAIIVHEHHNESKKPHKNSDAVNNTVNYTLESSPEELHITGNAVLGDNDVIEQSNNSTELPADTKKDRILLSLVRDNIIFSYGNNDTIIGGKGDDVYCFNANSGQDVIIDKTGKDTLRFGGQIDKSTAVFTKDGKDLVITFTNNSSDKITIMDWYKDAARRIERFEFTCDGSYITSHDSLIPDKNNKPDSHGKKDKPISPSIISRMLDDIDANIADLGFVTNTTFSSNDANLILARKEFNCTANDLNNIIIANPKNNVVWGLGGDDSIDAGLGNDTIYGGYGNDTYYTDDCLDKIIENMDQGTDTVNTIASYTLDANVENLILSGTIGISGTGNSLDNMITGNSLDNILNGDSGNDTLCGNAGNDTFIDSLGNDTYLFSINDGQDTICDASGNDTIQFDRDKSTATFTESGNDLIVTFTDSTDSITIQNWGNKTSKIEQFTFTDGIVTSKDIDTPTPPPLLIILAGTSGNDTLSGNILDNVIIGYAGNDLLIDTIGGIDLYVFNVGDGIDTITDTAGTSDIINLGNADINDVIFYYYNPPSQIVIDYGKTFGTDQIIMSGIDKVQDGTSYISTSDINAIINVLSSIFNNYNDPATIQDLKDNQDIMQYIIVPNWC